jgi:putative ABC transport system permease protein
LSPRNRSGWNDVSAADFVDLRRMSASFEQIAAYNWRDLNLTGLGEPERLRGFAVSPGFFELLRVQPALGRTFRADEEQLGRDAVAILSHDLWVRRFASNPLILGQTVQLDQHAFTVIGVMPSDFDFPPSAEIWTPLSFTQRALDQRAVRELFPLARLKDEVSLARAQADVSAIVHQLARSFPQTNAGVEAQVVPPRDFIASRQRQSFALMLLGAAMFVLLVACSNVANLQLARAAGRQSEMAIRAALGASRIRVIRQLLTESVLIAMLAAILGCFVASWAVNVIRTSIPPEISILVAGWKRLAVDPGAILFSIAIAAAAGCLAGIWPALRLTRPGLFDSVKSGARAIGGRAIDRGSAVLVIAEASLTFALVVGAGLLSKGFATLLEVQPGLDPAHVLTFHLRLPKADYRDQILP